MQKLILISLFKRDLKDSILKNLTFSSYSFLYHLIEDKIEEKLFTLLKL